MSMNREHSSADDNRKVTMPADLEPHLDWLAARVHEAWLANRTAAGWRLGPRRDDERHQHPSMVAFDELPEAERDLDRSVVIATLQGLTALGYHWKKD